MKQLESFFWGIIAALGALIMELVVFMLFSELTSQSESFSFTQLFAIPKLILVGAFIEESLKYLIISKRIELLSLGRSYITNSLLVGLGFFSIELGIAMTTGTLPETKLLFEVALIHMGTAGIMGYIIATQNPRKTATFLYALLTATFLHGAYNFLIIERTLVIDYAVFGLLIAIIIINILNFIRINKKLA